MTRKNRIFVFLLAAFVTLAWLGFGQNAPTAKDPVCGMSVKKDGAKFTYDYKGTTYYFCGQGCKDEFSKNPEKYLQPDSADTAKDPVCGMSVKKEGAKFTSDYKGTTYYFCCENCKTKFAQDPEKYLAKKDGTTGGPMVKGDEGGCCAGGCACKMKPIKK